MRLSFSKSKNSTSVYVIRSTYENGMRSSKIVEKLGTLEDIRLRINGQDPIEWAKQHVKELNKQEKENKRETAVRYSPVKLIEKGVRRTFNGGYLFFEQIYHELGIDQISRKISQKYNLTFDLSSFLSRLAYVSAFAVVGGQGGGFFLERSIRDPVVKDDNFFKTLDTVAKETEWIENVLYGNNSAALEGNMDKIRKKSQEIDSYFKAIESEFPATNHLSWEDRQKAHTMVCLIALEIGNCLERKLGGKYTSLQIVHNLREMNFFEIQGEGYVPIYMRTDFTDDLHEAFGFRTDYQIISIKEVGKILQIIESGTQTKRSLRTV